VNYKLKNINLQLSRILALEETTRFRQLKITDHLPKVGIIGETEKIADMLRIWEVLGALISS
jgi:hypothetical protein